MGGEGEGGGAGGGGRGGGGGGGGGRRRKLLKAFWRAFADGLIDSDEKVASSKTRVEKPCPLWGIKMAKIDSLF